MPKNLSMPKKLLALLAVLVLLAAACGSSDDDTQATDSQPGAGITLKIGQANWSSSYFLAEVHSALLRELGYEVASPGNFELAPEAGFVAIALREIDAWPSGWYPLHNNWLKSELTDGSLVEQNVEILGEQVLAGGVQGYVIDADFGNEHNILTLDDLNNNPAAIAALDEVDPDPGNGVVDLYGCPDNWTCDNVIEQQIAISGWENIRQFKGGSSYDFLAAAALAHDNDDEPYVLHLWGPSIHLTRLRPGDNVYWIGVNDIVDDSNPASQPSGESHDQRPGTQPIPASECPVAADRDDGLCPTGFAVVDILVTANREFVAEHPVAATLMGAVKIPAVDVSRALVEVSDGGGPAAAASKWIADNREMVDGWLQQAREAA